MCEVNRHAEFRSIDIGCYDVLSILRSDLYDSEQFSRIAITPNTNLPHVLELYYYASPVLTVFHLRSLIGEYDLCKLVLRQYHKYQRY